MEDLKAKYSFLPWMRQGLATRINEVDQLGETSQASSGDNSPTFDLTLLLKGEVNLGSLLPPLDKKVPITKTVGLYGPGDVVGIEQNAIAKTEPSAGINNFEYNFFPYIEFYEEDFPWRYTPLSANGDRLRPWLALVVLKESEFKRTRFRKGDFLSSFSLTQGLTQTPFPPADQMWAWAHVHVTGNLKDASQPQSSTEKEMERLDTILKTAPNLASSRILCPRKLEPQTRYFAFLIPAFEKGRLAGLGAPKEVLDATPLQLASWGHEQNHFSGFNSFQNQFPIYYDWNFQTGKVGEDFETMARAINFLDTDELPAGLGKQWIDIQSPGYKLHYGGGDFPYKGAVQMDGALRLPDSSIPDLLNSETEANTDFVEDLAALINLEDDMKAKENLAVGHKFSSNPYFDEDSESIYDDPIITPPLYGRWHANRNRVDVSGKTNWVDQLNLDPRNRMAAGLGAEVVRRKQENYMARAWDQFGELSEVNQFLRQTQFTLEVNKSIFQKHLVPQKPAQLLSITSSVHSAIRYENNLSLKGLINTKNLPNATATATYQKITRAGGSLMKRAIGKTKHPTTEMGKMLNIDIANITQVMYVLDQDTIEMKDPTQTITQTPGTIGKVDHYTFQPRLYKLINSAISDLNKSDIPDWKKQALGKNGVYGGMEAFRKGLDELKPYFDYRRWNISTVEPLDLEGLGENISQKINPQMSMINRLKVQLPELVKEDEVVNEQSVQPILAAPTFPDATYQEVLRISPDHLIPNLDLIPPNSSVLMETNRAFIESFMVGLNYEMARELLWREYPTDRRGTYFQHFWDATDKSNIQTAQKDISPIHRWAPTSLGSHQDTSSESEQLVLILRSDLLKRYPNTVVYMEKGEEQEHGSPRVLSGKEKRYPVFQASVKPDIYCLGFNITKEKALLNQGWFFVFEERSGEVRFGMDSPEQWKESDVLENWDDLNWKHLRSNDSYCIDFDGDYPQKNPIETQDIHWGKGKGAVTNDPTSGDGCAASMAWILYQKPVKIAIHASALLTKIKPSL